MIEFKKATLENADSVYEILKVCGLDLLENEGIDNWWPPYPKDKIVEDIQSEKKDVYLIYYNDVPVGTFMLLSSSPTYYDSSIWGDTSEKAMYPAKLAVLPNYRQYNLGIWCIKQYNKLARQRNDKYIRLDVYEKNTSVINIHKALGYKNIGIAKTRRFQVVCFEKEVR